MIDRDDLEITTFPFRDLGGQHVGTHVGVKVVHKPSGLTATSEDGRSQWQNREIAMNMILAGLTHPKAPASWLK